MKILLALLALAAFGQTKVDSSESIKGKHSPHSDQTIDDTPRLPARLVPQVNINTGMEKDVKVPLTDCKTILADGTSRPCTKAEERTAPSDGLTSWANLAPTGTGLALVSSTQYDWKEPDYKAPKKEPHFLLITRYWGSVLQSKGDNAMFVQDWTYQYLPFDTLKEVQDRLEASRPRESEIVGLWDLTKASKLTISFIDTEHVKPKYVDETRWTTREWVIK